MEAILVNGAEIPPAAVAAEMQYHPAPSRQQAWTAAATALVIRQLLLQERSRQTRLSLRNAVSSRGTLYE